MGKFGKKNKINLNPLAANICLLGLPKVGKTTLVKEISEKLVGENGYLFLELYHENGAKYIEDIVYEDVPTWDMLVEIIDDIVENKSTDYPDLQVVVFDTIDNALKLAEQEALRIWNKENPTKKTKSINIAYGGFSRGADEAVRLFLEQIFRLRQVGVAFTLIGHVKQANITDAVSLESYKQITSDITQRSFNEIKKNIDLVGVAYIDREIVKEKTGRKNIVSGKEEVINRVSGETRKISFRDPNYCVDSGGRLSEIVDEIPFSADEFIKAIKDALEAAVKKSGHSVDERRTENQKEEKETAKRIAESETIKKKVAEIVAFFNENKKDIDKVKPVVAKCKELGYDNPTLIDKAEDADAILAFIGEIAE